MLRAKLSTAFHSSPRKQVFGIYTNNRYKWTVFLKMVLVQHPYQNNLFSIYLLISHESHQLGVISFFSDMPLIFFIYIHIQKNSVCYRLSPYLSCVTIYESYLLNDCKNLNQHSTGSKIPCSRNFGRSIYVGRLRFAYLSRLENTSWTRFMLKLKTCADWA